MLDDLCLEGLAAYEDLDAVRAEAQRLSQALGFALWALSVPGLPEQPAWSIGNAPEDLQQAQLACMSERSLPAADRDGRPLPRWWFVAEADDAPSPVREFLAAARQVGVHGGLCIPVHAEGGLQGLLTLAASHPVSARELSAARPHSVLLSRYLLVACVPHVERFRARCTPRLSARERECLRWAARGKTTWEISRVLALSEHTVSHYLRNVVSKLGAVSRQQAIAQAGALGLLRDVPAARALPV